MTVSTTTNATMRTNANGLEPVSGRSSSIQPSGLAHRSHARPGTESATILIRYEAERTPAPIRLASCRVAAS